MYVLTPKALQRALYFQGSPAGRTAGYSNKQHSKAKPQSHHLGTLSKRRACQRHRARCNRRRRPARCVRIISPAFTLPAARPTAPTRTVDHVPCKSSPACARPAWVSKQRVSDTQPPNDTPTRSRVHKSGILVPSHHSTETPAPAITVSPAPDRNRDTCKSSCNKCE